MRRFACFIAVTMTSAFALNAQAAELAPHRAIYDLTVTESREAAGVNSGNGRLVYEFRRKDCKGFELVYRQVMKVKPSEGAESMIDFRATTFEDDGAQLLIFENSNTVNGTVDTALKGKAARDGGQIAVTIEKPESRDVALPENVLFPTEHLKRIIKAADEGRNLLEAKVFDGSGKADSAGQTLAMIGKPVASGKGDNNAVLAKMSNVRHWPISISYFEPAAAAVEQTPKFIFGADLYENGVAVNLRLDYGSFVVAGKLVGLALLPNDSKMACSTPQ